MIKLKFLNVHNALTLFPKLSIADKNRMEKAITDQSERDAFKDKCVTKCGKCKLATRHGTLKLGTLLYGCKHKNFFTDNPKKLKAAPFLD